VIGPLRTLDDWLQVTPAEGGRVLLSLDPGAAPVREAAGNAGPVTLLSGPEGGLGSGEESAAAARGFVRATLGPRVLRAETAPLVALARLT
jgi:16S rRNA (uracil1498-N3)-methyltransferase